MLFYIYSDAVGSTIDITDRCRVGRLSVKDNAEEGSVALSDLIIDDPDGDLNMTGHRRLYIYESECPILDQVIYYGWTANERVERGPYRVEAARQWTVSLADPNVLLNRRIMNGTDANRPAETDLARMLALLGMTELDTISDTTFVNAAAATTAMDACDYRNQNVGQYIDDCRQATGKNAYVYYSETVGGWGLWYDFPTSTAYDSGISLSNYLDDPDNVTVFGISQERTYLNRDPSRVASGIYLDWSGKPPVYVQDTDTRDAFTAIDWAAPSLNVKSSAKATARANRYLADADEEDEVIHTVMVNVPRNKVNVLKKGQLVQFAASHLPGYEAYVTCRVLYRSVTEISEDPQASFEIEMDLTPLPVPGDAFCILQWPVEGDAGIEGRRFFMNSGDNPHAGSPMNPTTGLLHKVDSGDTPGIWSGIEVDGTGTVDIYWHTSFIWTYSGQATARWSILVNGVEVAFTTETDPTSGLNNWTESGTVQATGIAVSPGNVIEALLSFSGSGAPPTSFFSSPAGTGSGGNQLKVNGSLA